LGRSITHLLLWIEHLAKQRDVFVSHDILFMRTKMLSEAFNNRNIPNVVVLLVMRNAASETKYPKLCSEVQFSLELKYC
jgi:hypothetical protein